MKMFRGTLALAVFLPAMALAQTISFGGLKGDTTLPVEVTSASLTVDQQTGEAVFAGNVVVIQGEMRLAAQEVRVEYAKDAAGKATKIARLHASGGVTLVNATEAAEGDEAVYTIDSGEVVMTGSVLVTQNTTAISGDRLIVYLKDGTGRVDGNVKTILNPEGN